MFHFIIVRVFICVGNAKLLLQEYVNKNHLSPLVFRHTQTYRHVQTYNGINNVVGYVCSVTVRGDIYGSIGKLVFMVF